MILIVLSFLLRFEFESKDEASGVVIGTYTWSNGDKYKGTWKHGKRHGKVSTSSLIALPTNPLFEI